MPIVRPAIALVAGAWVILLVTAPTAALGVPLSGMVYLLGALICHQRPERSFHVASAQLPVCARCFGLYLGAAIGALMWRSVLALAEWRGASALRDARVGLAIAAIPTAVTWTSEVAGLWTPSNMTRFAAALPLGMAVAIALATTVRGAERGSLR